MSVRPTPRRGTSLLIISLLAVLTAVLLIIFVLRLSTSSGGKVQLGTNTLELGSASRQAAEVAKGGPLLLPSLGSAGLDLWVQHLGTNPIHGWLAFQDRGADGCTLLWQASQHDLLDPCSKATYPADGRGLEQFRVTVDPSGKLTVDPRQPIGTMPVPT